MDRDALTRGIILSLVDRALRELERDPERTVRKLVDLGGQFAKGRFQSYFFHMVQTMLNDENSAYYDLVRRTASNVDRETLKTFGFNLGYNSCTAGARVIRQFESECGYDIPWAIMFHLNGGAGQMEAGQYERLLREAQDDGVYSFIFYAENGKIDLQAVLELVSRHPNCAFLLAAPATLITDESVSRMSELRHLMVAVDSRDAGFPEAASRLSEARMLYACHRRYENRADAEEILSGTWARRAAEAGCSFAFCHAHIRCPDDVCDAVTDYVRAARDAQSESVILSNYYTDHLFIDSVISGEPCFIGVEPDGTVNRCDGRREEHTGENVRDRSLNEVLSALCTRPRPKQS